MEMTETRAEGMTPQAQRRMTPDDYERERQRIRAIYGDSPVEAGAQRDQALAALFYRSGWTQEELAKQEKKKQPYISQRLLFGRFLAFIAGSNNLPKPPKNLSEWRFRGYWLGTADDASGNERQRFAEVARMIEAETGVHKSHAKKNEVGDSIMEAFADGKWHKLATIETHVQEQVKASAEDVHTVLEGMERKGNYGSHCERKQVGTSHSYRIVRKSGKSIDVDVLTQELEPLLMGLEAEGRKNMATMSPSTVAHLVQQLRKLIEKMAK